MASFSDTLKNIFWVFLILQFASPVIKNIHKQWTDHTEPKNKVGIIVVNQMISSSTRINKQLRQFFKDSEIKAILLKVDSPGGAAGSSQAICQEIIALKKQYPKPIVTYSENLCASGAYGIASHTDYIVATGNALVGSVGSKLCTQFKLKKLLEDYKVQTVDVASGSYKNSTDPFVDITDQQREMLQKLTDDCYDQFVQEVATSRHIDIAKKDFWANGRLFTGREALGLKLIDELGNQTVALRHIKKLILHSDREIELVKIAQPSPWQRFMHSNDEDSDDELECFASSMVWGSLFGYLQKRSVIS